MKMTRTPEPRQIPLDLAPEPSFTREAFLPAACNMRALNEVFGWQGWDRGQMVLSGPPASGKTHLAHIWATLTEAEIVAANDLPGADIVALAAGAVAVEDADGIAGDMTGEQALFHLHNATRQAGTPLLLTSRAEPGRWNLHLPDLASRVSATHHVRLEAPNDALLAAVLVKLFDDRQIGVSPRLIDWLLRRMDRSLASAREVVGRLDERALASGGPVTREMAAEILDISLPDPT